MSYVTLLRHHTSPKRDSAEGKSCAEVSCALLLCYAQYLTHAAPWVLLSMGLTPRRASAYLLSLPLEALVSHPRGRGARQGPCSSAAGLGGPRCLLISVLLAERLLQALGLLLVVLVEAVLLLQEVLVLRHHAPQPLLVLTAAAQRRDRMGRWQWDSWTRPGGATGLGRSLLLAAPGQGLSGVKLGFRGRGWRRGRGGGTAGRRCLLPVVKSDVSPQEANLRVTCGGKPCQ
ncbi:hypothetical protein E2C01_055756 [Portunus trituberculatus]|uniref:Uncharacterized protein n=1 Tax=Portunus trituberculatus TaxID=210409 RepID=A0A5B7GNK1_PORTR|nr:hypothetical protein [Portunus trituberculatus]